MERGRLTQTKIRGYFRERGRLTPTKIRGYLWRKRPTDYDNNKGILMGREAD